MGKFREVLQEWTSTHVKICKVVSVLALITSVILIIAGAVLASQNSGRWDPKHEDFNDFVERQSRYAGGIAMILLGIFFFVFSLVSFCFAFQMKYVQRAVEPSSNQVNHQGYPPTHLQQPQMPPMQPSAQPSYSTYDDQQQPLPMYYPPTAPISNSPPPYKE